VSRLPPAIATSWPSVTCVTGHRIWWSWRDLLLAIVRDLGRPHPERCHGWSPALFAGNRRGLDHLETVTALCLDYDAGEQSLEDVTSAWSNWRGLVHSSKSHTTAHPRLRVVLPLAEPVDVAGHRRLSAWAVGRSAGLDVGATSDPARLWWWPSTVTGEHCYAWLRGRLLRLRDAPPIPPPPVRPPRSGPRQGAATRYAEAAVRSAGDRIASASVGDRHATLLREAWSLSRLVRDGLLDEGGVVSELTAAALEAGKPEREVERAIRDAFRAAARRGA